MTQTTISLTGGGVRDAHTLNIVISIDATINIDFANGSATSHGMGCQ